jgi:hypothetical protein
LISLIDSRNLNDANAEIYNYVKTSVNRLDHIVSDLGKIIDIRNDIYQIREKIDLQEEVNAIVTVLKKEIDAYNVRLEMQVVRKFFPCGQWFIAYSTT